MNKSGIILLEIIVSLLVFALGIVFIIQGLSRVVTNNRGLSDRSLAVTAGGNFFTEVEAGIRGPEEDENYKSYGREFRLKSESSVLEGDLRKIRLEIAWQERGAERVLRLERILFLPRAEALL